MRKLVVGTFVTLDGVMQAPGGPDEDRDGGFQHGGWLVPYFDEKLVEIMTDWTKRAGAFRLVDTQLTTTGAVLHVYERVGPLKYGEVEVGQEPVVFDSDARTDRKSVV